MGAHSADLPAYGGPGGDTAYRIECPPQSLLTGFSGRGGSEPGGVSIECRQRDAAGRLGDIVPAAGSGAAGRSVGGAAQRKACGPHKVIYTVNFLFTRSGTTLSWLRARCVDVTDSRQSATELSFPAPDTPQLGDPMQSFPGSGWQSCPPGELPVGIHGTSRTQVDSIGLICRPLSAASKPAKEAPALWAVMRSPF